MARMKYQARLKRLEKAIRCEEDMPSRLGKFFREHPETKSCFPSLHPKCRELMEPDLFDYYCESLVYVIRQGHDKDNADLTVEEYLRHDGQIGCFMKQYKHLCEHNVTSDVAAD